MDDVSVNGLNDTNESIRSSKRQSYSRGSVEDPLLRRSLSVASYAQNWTGESITSQKVHIISEDLTIVIAGFSTSITGLVLYYILCALSFGFAYLLFRWFPKWRVRLLGKPAPLCACKWVVIEVGSFTSEIYLSVADLVSGSMESISSTTSRQSRLWAPLVYDFRRS